MLPKIYHSVDMSRYLDLDVKCIAYAGFDLTGGGLSACGVSYRLLTYGTIFLDAIDSLSNFFPVDSSANLNSPEITGKECPLIRLSAFFY
jgi:hypothetical protein